MTMFRAILIVLGIPFLWLSLAKIVRRFFHFPAPAIIVLPEIPDQGRALAEVRRVLKPGGIFAVTEFLPDPDYPLSSTTVKRGEAAGFEVEGVYGNLWNYTVRFKYTRSGGNEHGS